MAHERLGSVEQQQTELGGEQEQQEDAIIAGKAHADALEAQVAQASETADATAIGLEGFERAGHAARQEHEREEARLRAAQRDVIQAQARLGEAQTELGRLQRQLGDVTVHWLPGMRRLRSVQRKLETSEQALAGHRRSSRCAREAVADLVSQREQLGREIAEAQSALERLRAAMGDSERERRARPIDWRCSKMAPQHGGIQRRAAYPPSVQTIRRPPVIGVVSQVIGAPAGLR